jgi:alkaline phosphatase
MAEPIVDAQGHSLSIAKQAIRAGLPVGLVQSGTSTEPGTGCFLASVPLRKMHEQIALQLIESGAAVMLGGGEKFYLPEGVEGVYGMGVRRDGRNLIEEARQKGYTVVRTREELLNLPAETDKVLGLFAEYHTFNDKPEEVLQAMGKQPYNPEAPTIAEMTEVALKILDAKDERFLMIVEEEGTDNFGNKNNASGFLEAMKRADEACGVLRRYVAKQPKTLIVNAADSDGGGPRMVGFPIKSKADIPKRLPARDFNGSPMDGVRGSGTAPFMAAPDQFGQQLPFGVVWAAQDDVSGGILVRGEGLNADRIQGVMDNTEITHLMRLTLFGQAMPMEPAKAE